MESQATIRKCNYLEDLFVIFFPFLKHTPSSISLDTLFNIHFHVILGVSEIHNSQIKKFLASS